MPWMTNAAPSGQPAGFTLDSEDGVQPFDIIDTALNFLVPGSSWATSRLRGEEEPEGGLLGSVTRPISTVVKPIDTAVRAIPGGSFLLDLPNRAVNTVAMVGQRGDWAANANPDEYWAGWAEVFNKDNWSKAWDSWGQPNQLTAGAIWSSEYLLNNDERIRYADPFDAMDAQAIQENAHSTWYGELTGAAIDISAGFATPFPGLKTLGASRAAKVVSLSQAEKMAEVWNASAKVPDAFKATKAKDTLKVRAGGEAGTESLISQMVANVQGTDGIKDLNSMMNHLSPYMQNATEAAKRDLAVIFLEANRRGPTLATDLKMNALLAMMGSGAAKSAIRDSAPLLLRSMENAATAPVAFSVADDLLEARRAGGGTEFSVNAVLDKHFGLPGAKAEEQALRAEVAARLDDAKKAKQYQREALAESVKGGALPTLTGDLAAATSKVERAATKAAASQAALKAKKAEVKLLKERQAEVAPGLARDADMLTTIWNAGEEGYILTGRTTPSRLDKIKTAYRETVGEEWLYPTGDKLPNVFLQVIPTRPLAAIGTPRARGGINMAEVDKGRLELMESLKRSKTFSPDEIRQVGNTFVATPADRRGLYVTEVQDRMLERVAAKHGLSADDALAAVATAKRAYGEGRQYWTKALDDAADSNIVTARGLDGEIIAHDKAMLQTHLQDTAPFIDPTHFNHALKALDEGMTAKGVRVANYADDMNTMFQTLWKHSVLLRPGLATRAMLDTELRAVAMVGSMAQMMAAANGSRKLTAKGLRGVRSGIARRGLSRPLEQRVSDAMGMKPLDLEVGAGQTAKVGAYQDIGDEWGNLARMGAMRSATTKGTQVHTSILANVRSEYNRLTIDHSRWDHYAPTNSRWPLAYGEHAQVMLNSPTVRAMLKHMDEDGTTQAADIPSYVRELFQNPAVASEYSKIALPDGVSKVDYVQQIMEETYRMFPTADIAKAVQSGVLSNKKSAQGWIAENFPNAEDRFHVPGPHSILEPNNNRALIRRNMDKVYRLFLDAPDWWGARHPVYVRQYERTIRSEAASLLDLRRAEAGPDGMLSADDLRSLDSRAKTAAATAVRNTMFDTTRYTGAHHYVSKVAPFFAPWEDAAMSWSRLMYDNPARVFRLGGAWNTVANASPWLPAPIFVDGNGKPLAHGEKSDNGKYILLPIKFPGGQDVRISQEALNSIAQGNVAWLPGFGPTTQISTTAFLTRPFMHDTALALSESDNWAVENFMQSMFYEGEVPPGDPANVARQLLPSTVRNLYNDIWGDNYAANVSFHVNNAYIQAQKEGLPFDQEQALKDAEAAARTAGIVRMVQQGVIGLSGRATVEGQFYVDQMHQISAKTPEQLKVDGFGSPEEEFAFRFPEAAKLDWYLSRNETGINATVNAENRAASHKGLIDKYPEMGWFIVGDENVGGEFSQTAYNMQRSQRYGISQKGRVRESPEQTVRGAVVAQGWDAYQKFSLQLDELDLTEHLTEQERAFLKQSFVKFNAAQNREWFVEYNTQANRLGQFYSDADAIAARSDMQGRDDIEAYKDYRAAREEVLAGVGLKSLTGTSSKSALARAYLRRIGEQMAKSSPGFHQMWTRQLSSEVDPLPGDSEALDEELVA